MNNGIQHKLSKVRPPRVQITYDVETSGAIEKKQLPFVMGVITNLSNSDPNSIKPYNFVSIDNDNMPNVLEKMQAELNITSRKYKSDKETKNFKVIIKKIEDFSPSNLVKQIPDLQLLTITSKRLTNLFSVLEVNSDLRAAMEAALTVSSEGNNPTADTKNNNVNNNVKSDENINNNKKMGGNNK